MAKNFVPLVGGGVQMPASAEAVAADIARLDSALGDLAEDVGVLENWDAGDIPYDSSETYDDNTVGAGLNDLKSAINNSLTPYVTDSMTAPAALSVGDYVMANNTLYRVIAPIANGATITPNTNAIATTEADELKRKANTNGNYPDMTVGNAEQLVATIGVEDKVPYNFRTSGGSADIGDREVDSIVGGTVAWNQGYDKTRGTTATGGGVTFTNNGDGSWTLTNNGTGTYRKEIMNGALFKAGHKYLITGGNSFSGSSSTVQLVVTINGAFLKAVDSSTVINADYDYNQFSIRTYEGFVGGTNGVKIWPQFFDLTQMFGSTIADYIYTLETATPGAGAAWFKKLFPKYYYAYDAGSLQSVKTSAHRMTGFNQWDEEWEVGGINSTTGGNTVTTGTIRSKNYIPVIPGTVYYFKSPVNCWWHSYDANKNYLGVINYGSSFKNATKTLGNNVYYLRFQGNAYGNTYNHDICINLHWDGEKDGTYEPYELHSYALSDIELRGIPKLDADNKLYYDGDTYQSDGTVTRKYGIVDLGTLTWDVENTSTGQFYINNVNANTQITSMKFHGNLVCAKYLNNPNGSYGNLSSGQISATNSQANVILRVVDSAYINATAAAFKTAMNGVYLVYELATPATETADPYQNPQIVNDFGTEEYVDAAVAANTRDVAIPVGHDTTYRANLRAKLEMAPDSPDGDGDYIVRQTSGENVYVPITFPADELPAAPTTDGTYVLKATVSSGTATFSWVSE